MTGVDQRGRSSDVSGSEGCAEVHAGAINELDLNRRYVVGQGIEAGLAYFVTAESEVHKVGVAEQHDEEAVLVAEFVGEKSLELRNDGSANAAAQCFSPLGRLLLCWP